MKRMGYCQTFLLWLWLACIPVLVGAAIYWYGSLAVLDIFFCVLLVGGGGMVVAKAWIIWASEEADKENNS